jgi:hypothetical protein
MSYLPRKTWAEQDYENKVFREIVEHNLTKGKGKPVRYFAVSSPGYDALSSLERNGYIEIRESLPEEDGLLTYFLDMLTGVQRAELTDIGAMEAGWEFPEYFSDTKYIGAAA